MQYLWRAVKHTICTEYITAGPFYETSAPVPEKADQEHNRPVICAEKIIQINIIKYLITIRWYLPQP